MRLTLIIASLGCGGAERVMATMANYWAAKGWQITLATYDDGTAPPFYDFHPTIRLRPLGIARVSPGAVDKILNNLERIAALRQAIKESSPDVVISFIDTNNVLVLLSTLFLCVPVIVSEHSSPAHYSAGRVWTYLRRRLYPHASRVIVLTEEALAYFAPKIRRRARVIPNPVVVNGNAVPTLDDVKADAPTLIALGRLSREKGFDLLLEAFTRIADRHPDWSLVVWGEGPERAYLEELRDRLGLRGRIRLPGLTRSPNEQLKKADLFVMPSRLEGFPMALCEAMACGLPVVSFDCPSGPRNIIRDGIDGLLVPPGDVPALAASLSRLMGDEDERRRLASRAPEVAERFALEKVMGQWEEVVLGAVGRESGPEATP
jgi:GalNAc-alpha-(1->4)-GalNAc-alpha-(1->3)-diNAcBac-PP-undecaprenol alpha-1,4-N-acetyl-D-galactosaminyltransferase